LIDSKFYIEAERFFYLADHSPPKEIPKSFFFNIDNVAIITIRIFVTRDFSKTSDL